MSDLPEEVIGKMRKRVDIVVVVIAILALLSLVAVFVSINNREDTTTPTPTPTATYFSEKEVVFNHDLQPNIVIAQPNLDFMAQKAVKNTLEV